MTTTPRRTTVADVAALAGTSTAVVSYVINDGPRPVAPATRAKVLSAIDTLGFRPSRGARALRVQRSSFIGLVVPGTADPFYVQHSHAVEAAAGRRDHLTMSGNSGFDADQEATLTAALIDEGVDGMVILGVGGSQELSRVLDRSPVRRVFVHHRPHGVRGPLIRVDDRGWAARATAHLIGHGHARVALLTHLDDEGPVGQRVEGWRDALVSAGLDPTDDLIVRSPIDRSSASAAVEAWLSAPDRANAVFAATDELAFGLLHQAGRLGIRIPDELAVFSFDGVDAAAMTVPELSTVREPFDEMGERAVQLLLDGEPGDASVLAGSAIEVKDCEMVYRTSCGCGVDGV